MKLFTSSILGIVFASFFTQACVNTATQGEAGSSTSSVKINLPKIPGLNYNAYSFQINRGAGFENNTECSEDFSIVRGISESVHAQQVVKNGCDYFLVLELGELDTDAKGLAKKYYSNLRTESPKGQILKAAELKGGVLTITIKLYKVDSTLTAPPSIDTPGETNLNIEIKIGDTQPPSSNDDKKHENHSTNVNIDESHSLNASIANNATATSFSELLKHHEYLVVDFSESFCGGCLSLAEQLANRPLNEKCGLVTVVPKNDLNAWAGALQRVFRNKNLVASAVSHSFYDSQSQKPFEIAQKSGRFANAIPFVMILDRSFSIKGTAEGTLPEFARNQCY